MDNEGVYKIINDFNLTLNMYYIFLLLFIYSY